MEGNAAAGGEVTWPAMRELPTKLRYGNGENRKPMAPAKTIELRRRELC